MGGASAWVGMRYSFRPGLSSRAVFGSVALPSSRAWPMPIIPPPRIWFSAVLWLRMRPAPHAPAIRSTRTSPRSGSTVTTANQAPNDQDEVSGRTMVAIFPPEMPVPEAGSHWLNPSRVVSCRRSRTSP